MKRTPQGEGNDVVDRNNASNTQRDWSKKSLSNKRDGKELTCPDLPLLKNENLMRTKGLFNRAGSASGINFVVCSYGKFQLGPPG